MDVPIACICPDRPDGSARHPDGDTVTLRERLDFRATTTVRWAMGLVREGGGATPEVLAAMTEWYCLLGIESWTLVDAADKPVPVSRDEIRARIIEAPDAFEAATAITDAADDLYMAAVFLPLLDRASTSSRPGPTPASTSAPTGSPTRPPKRSSPSSTTSTRTAGTGTTTSRPDGVSSTSPSAASAA